MSLLRSIGRWSLAALIVNTMIGSGIFGIPSELTKLVGRASPLAMIFAAVGWGLMMCCFAEVASQFDGAGGAYLYTRTAFGRFVGMQVAWFSWLGPIGACAASANLFVVSLQGFWPGAGSPIGRAATMIVLLTLLTVANYVGVKSGTRFSNLFTAAKLLPLAVLILIGLVRFGPHAQVMSAHDIVAPGFSGWVGVLLLLAFMYAGFETALMPGAEMKDPRREIPWALATALLTTMAIYTMIQFVVVATIGTTFSPRPLADTAQVLIGNWGATFVTLVAMISTYGSVSAMFLAAPRLTYSLAAQGDFPKFFGKIHPKFNTPHISILFFGFMTLVLAYSGTFRWALAVASGAIIMIYATVCAALIQLRRKQPQAAALRVPGGPAIAVVCMAIAAVLLSRLSPLEASMLVGTSLVAAGNWFLVKGRKGPENDVL